MPKFSEVIGQESVHRLLEGALERDRLPHAYIFHGSPGVGKTTTAFALAQRLNCLEATQGDPCGACSPCRKYERLQHPDLHWHFPMPASVKGGKRAEEIRKQLDERLEPGIFRFHFSTAASIAIGRDKDTRAGSVAELRHQAGMHSVEARTKVFVISEADRMTDAAANSLLKILEEPRPGNLLILCTSNPGALLDTILSRCQALRFRDLTEDEIVGLLQEKLAEPPSKKEAQLAAALAQGSLSRATGLVEEEVVEQRDRAVRFLNLLPDSPESHLAVADLVAMKDRVLIERLFDFGDLWLGDVLRVLAGSSVPLANRDAEDLVRKHARSLTIPEIKRRMAVLKEARRALRGNVYLPLILRDVIEKLHDRTAIPVG